MKAAIESAAPDVAVQDEWCPRTKRIAWRPCIGSAFSTPQPSEGFDAVARLAATALRVPIVLVSLVDAERLWFKSRIGLGVRETARHRSFCAQVVFQRHPLIVRDARRIRASRSTRWWPEPRSIRSYLGIPLYTARRANRSARCARWMTQVRDFGEREVAVLTEFAKIVEEFLGAKAIRARRPTAFCSMRWSARSCFVRPSNRPRWESCIPR